MLYLNCITIYKYKGEDYVKKRLLCVLLVLSLLIFCSCKQQNYGLSAKNPQSITIWHYYNGSLAVQFENLIQEFNRTVGRDMGIVVYAEAKTNIDHLLSDLKTSTKKQIGSSPLPNIFHCYPDIAMEVLKYTDLVSLDTYISEKEKQTFVNAYIKEGSIGENNTWYLFPIAKSAEVMMLNKTAWDKFSADTGVSTDSLATWEGVVEIVEQYYNWSGGSAFLGIDSFSNYMEVGAAQLGKHIFLNNHNGLDVQIDYDTFKKLWDCYYIPYINGHYMRAGRFRSDDIKIGKIIANISSTSSASYFPHEVTTDDHTTYPIDCLVLPVPKFEQGIPYRILQGADMAIMKSTPKEEYASIVFLQWFTQKEQNLRFTLQSGYLPVKKDVLNLATIEAFYQEHETSQIIENAIYTALEQFETDCIYTAEDYLPYEARILLNDSMPALAKQHREELLSASDEIATQTLLDAYSNPTNFDKWYQHLLAELLAIVNTK